MKLRELTLIGALIFVILSGYNLYISLQKDKEIREFAAKEQRLKAQMDSVVQLQREADLFAIQMATKYNVAKQDLAYQSKVTEKLKNRFDALRHLSVPRLSDSAIDSAVKKLYPIR